MPSAKPDILDRTRYYQLREEGPLIDKTTGAGRVLSTLLNARGEDVSLAKLIKVSEWRRPERTMSRFVDQINNWCEYHKIQPNYSGRTANYRLVRIKPI